METRQISRILTLLVVVIALVWWIFELPEFEPVTIILLAVAAMLEGRNQLVVHRAYGWLIIAVGILLIIVAGWRALRIEQQYLDNSLYLLSGASLHSRGELSFSSGTQASQDEIPSNHGDNFDGNPYQQLIYFIKGVNGTYNGGRTGFTLYIDSREVVGNGVQLRVSYDFEGNDRFDRVETYSYFATDNVIGWQPYTENSFAGLQAAAGEFKNLENGTIRIELWHAIGTDVSYVRTSADPLDGLQSHVKIPYKDVWVSSQ